MRLALTYGNRRFLFTGDAGFENEGKLNAAMTDSDVLKIGHHGSKYASDAAFLDKVSPAVAVISVGKGNPLLAKEYVFVSIIHKSIR